MIMIPYSSRYLCELAYSLLCNFNGISFYFVFSFYSIQNFVVIGKYEYSEIGKKRYLKNGNNDAVKTATSMQ